MRSNRTQTIPQSGMVPPRRGVAKQQKGGSTYQEQEGTDEYK